MKAELVVGDHVTWDEEAIAGNRGMQQCCKEISGPFTIHSVTSRPRLNDIVFIKTSDGSIVDRPFDASLLKLAV